MHLNRISIACIFVLLFFLFLIPDLQAQDQSNGEISVQPNRPSISELKLRGRIQGQYANSSGQNSDTGIEAGSFSSFELRRVRMGVQGKIYNDFAFILEANIHDHANLDVADFAYTALPLANIVLGKNKPRFGHEQFTSSAEILTFERSQLDGLLNAGKPLGFRIFGEKNVFNYYLGVFNAQHTGASSMSSAADSYLYNASVGLNLGSLLSDDLRLDLRADYLHNKAETGYYNFEHSYAFSARFELFEVFDLRTEFMTGEQFDDNNISGFYLMPSYFILPKKLQAVIRYENSTGDDGLFLGHNRYADRVPDLFDAGNKYQALYSGFNYYVHSHNLKFMIAVEIAENQSESDNFSGKSATFFCGFRMQF